MFEDELENFLKSFSLNESQRISANSYNAWFSSECMSDFKSYLRPMQVWGGSTESIDDLRTKIYLSYKMKLRFSLCEDQNVLAIYCKEKI